MARTPIDIVITVRDGASSPLTNVQAKLKSTGKAAKDTSVDFVQFNKTLFTTAAFIGTFVKGVTSMRDAMSLGGDLERLSNQYERILGPKGKLFTSIDEMTTTAIGRMDALKAGVELRNLGIAQNSDQIAAVLAKAGTAAKLSGMDASEGIAKFTDFLKDGSVANLEALGLIRRTDPSFQALLATLNKAGGIYGTVLSTQAKLNIGMGLLDKRTRGHLKGIRDLKDINLLLNDSFSILKRQIGGLIGQAIGPLLEKLIPLIYKLGDVFEHIKNGEKHIMFLAKSILTITTAVAGFISVLGTLKLAVRLLGFAGIGLPGLLIATLAMTAGFIGLTQSADGVLEKMRLLGAIFKGVYELVTNLDPETGMSKISKSTKDLLEKYGLLGFVQTIARIVSVIKTVLGDMYDLFKKVAKSIDDTFGGIFTKFKDYIADFSKNWTTWWVTDSLTPLQKTVRGAITILAPLLAIFAGKKLLGGLLGSLPIIGNLFKGGGIGSGPKGTASDPIHVISAGDMLKSIVSITGIGTLIDVLKRSYEYGGWKAILKDIPFAFSLAFPRIASIFTGIATSLSTIFAAGATGMMAALNIAFAAGQLLLVAGISYALGTLANKWLDKNTQGKTKEGYEGSIIERAFFKLDQMFNGDASSQFNKGEAAVNTLQNTSNADLVKEFRKTHNVPGSNYAKSSQSTLDNFSDDQIIQGVAESMQNQDAVTKAKVQNQMELAMQTRESNGRLFSTEELGGMEQAFAGALRKDPNLSAMGDKAKESAIKKPLNQRANF